MTTREPDNVSRTQVPELDELLGRRLAVLEDGFVRVVDYMGSDQAIVQAARVSYGEGTKRVREDRALIRYLTRHRHTTPFEMCELKLHVRVPMDVWRQWIRHRTASVNEYSTRYSVAIDAAHTTPPTGWRLQAQTNRQGSDGVLDSTAGAHFTAREAELLALARKIYDERLASGIAREQARKDLPLSTYTEAYWKIDLHNLFHFLALRMDPSAQYEIRAYATIIGEQIVARWCPIAWEAFKEYRLNSLAFSATEVDVIRGLLRSPAEGRAKAIERGLLDANGAPLPRNRELAELEEKLITLGLSTPWREQ